ncbi:MAG: hypothetical protein KF878_00455 [Planctomycetes bacterium]|nr:hypothetical protein [Planctomycetota bacterium]
MKLQPTAALVLLAVGCSSAPPPPPRTGEPVSGTLDDVPASALQGLDPRPWSCPPGTWTKGQRFAYEVRAQEGGRVVDADAAPGVAPPTLVRRCRFDYEVTEAGDAVTRLRVTLSHLEQAGPEAEPLEGLAALVGHSFLLLLDARGAPEPVSLHGPVIERCFGKEAALTGAGLGAAAAGLLMAAREPFHAVPRGRALAPGDRWGDHERGLVYRYLGREPDDTVRVRVELLEDERAPRGEWLAGPGALLRLSAAGATLEQPDARWVYREEGPSPGARIERAGSAGVSLLSAPAR